MSTYSQTCREERSNFINEDSGAELLMTDEKKVY